MHQVHQVHLMHLVHPWEETVRRYDSNLYWNWICQRRFGARGGPMTEEAPRWLSDAQLAAMRLRSEAAQALLARLPRPPTSSGPVAQSARDVPVLLAEVDRLRAALRSDQTFL